jgi:hypothetical protein
MLTALQNSVLIKYLCTDLPAQVTGFYSRKKQPLEDLFTSLAIMSGPSEKSTKMPCPRSSVEATGSGFWGALWRQVRAWFPKKQLCPVPVKKVPSRRK